MSNGEQWLILDDDRSIEISDDYDPMLKEEFDEYIHVTEKRSPGLRMFNGVANRETCNVQVTGLTLDFSESMGESRLMAIIGRENIAELYLYADTITITARIRFPQANVHIFARRLILEGTGAIDTTPSEFPLPASGGTPEKMAKGQDAANAGNLYLNVQEVITRNEEVFKEPKVTIPANAFTKLELKKTYNDASWRMFPDGSMLELDLDFGEKCLLLIALQPSPPNTAIASWPDHFHYVGFSYWANRALNVSIKSVGFSSRETSKTLSDYPRYWRILYEPGKLTVFGSSDRSTYTEYVSMSDPKHLTNTKYLGFGNYESEPETIKRCELTPIRKTPRFILQGGTGQEGQRGGFKERPIAENSGEKEHPVTFDKIWSIVRDWDTFKAPDKSSWEWGPVSWLGVKNVFFVELKIYNRSVWENEGVKTVKLGNADASNPNNGLDAYASGDGGNGGAGGTLSVTNNSLDWDKLTDTAPGASGQSLLIRGGKKINDDSVTHLAVGVVHKDIPSLQVYRRFATQKVTKNIPSRDGFDAVGKPGKPGKAGAIKTLANRETVWLHPYLLESVLQFAKDRFMQGNRTIALWLINLYQKPIDAANGKLVHQGLQSQDLTHQIRVLAERLNSRLDYFGNPVGWVPRLTTVTNIQLLKLIERNTVELLYFSNQILRVSQNDSDMREHLDFAVDQLKKEIEDDRKRLADAHEECAKLKTELNKISSETERIDALVRNLRQKATTQFKEKEEAQLMFTGALQICSGLCHLIPVGQPFVGQIGGSLLDAVSGIDINSDAPFGEGLKLTAGIADELGGFIDDNKKELTQAVNSDLNKRIKSNQKSIDSTTKESEAYTKQLAEHKASFEKLFKSNYYQKLKIKLKLAYSVDSFESLEFYSSEDYQNLISEIQSVEKQLDTITELSEIERKTIKDQLKPVLAEQKALKKSKSELEEKVNSRTKTLENAGKVTQQIGKAISGVAGGIQTLMKSVDESDPAFREKIDGAMTSDVLIKDDPDQKTYGERFRELKEQLDTLNTEKLPVANKLIKLQQIIDSSCGTVMARMNQMAEFTDQRTKLSVGTLSPSTKQYLHRVIGSCRELMLEQVDNLIKSYQYRFLTPLDTDFYQVNQLVDDIILFQTAKDGDIPNRSHYKNAYDFALRSRFNALAQKLLIEMQRSDRPKQDHFSLTIDEKTETKDGLKLLDQLKRTGKANFRMHELAGSKAKGSDQYFNYRIANITFTDIKVETKEEDISFRLGIRHSGESVIRHYHNRREQYYYYFTTVNAPADSSQEHSFRRHWSATFNQSDIDHASGKNGLTNSIDVVEDEKALSELLSGINKDAKLDYHEHLPGATSELTLLIFDNNIDALFEIKEVKIKFMYEVKDRG